MTQVWVEGPGHLEGKKWELGLIQGLVCSQGTERGQGKLKGGDTKPGAPCYRGWGRALLTWLMSVGSCYGYLLKPEDLHMKLVLMSRLRPLDISLGSDDGVRAGAVWFESPGGPKREGSPGFPSAWLARGWRELQLPLQTELESSSPGLVSPSCLSPKQGGDLGFLAPGSASWLPLSTPAGSEAVPLLCCSPLAGGWGRAWPQRHPQMS